MTVINFVSGCSGFVASHLMEYLLSKGETVIGSYRWNEDLSRAEKYKDKITMIPMDLTDLTSCIKATNRQIDYVYHLAAQSYVPDSFIYPEATMNVNGLGTYRLLEAIRLNGQPYPVIFVCSSSEVYGQVLENELPVTENQPFRPANPYGVSKCTADLYAKLYFDNYKMPIIRTRMFTHTGYGRTMESAEVSFARQIALIEKGKQKPVIKVGNLDSIRTFADVRDAVRAYYLLVRKCTYGEVYNIGGNYTCSIGDMLNYLISLSTVKDIKVEVDHKKLRPSDVTLQIPSSEKFKNETNWEPIYRFEDTMKELLRFWREKVDNK
jgi:GDP-mannose 4,6-dehydratase